MAIYNKKKKFNKIDISNFIKIFEREKLLSEEIKKKKNYLLEIL